LNDSTFQQLSDVVGAFQVEGAPVKSGDGWELLRIRVEGESHLLKRYHLSVRNWWRQPTSRGLHELRMVHWMHTHGFRGPQVVARGRARLGGLITRVFFVMRETNETPLEPACRQESQCVDRVIPALGHHLAQLHGLGFSCKHLRAENIHVDLSGNAPAFRHMALAGARIGTPSSRRVGHDLQSLITSIDDAEIRRRFEDRLLIHYLRSVRKSVDQEAVLRGFAKAGGTPDPRLAAC
jgi:hypothetical protein